MWTWNPGPLLPWETLLVTLGEVNRVMTEGKALIAQTIFFFQTGNFFIKYKVEQFYMGLPLLRGHLNAKPNRTGHWNTLSSVLYFSTASKGLLDAAHFCYLMAQVGFGVYTRKTTKLVLIGSNHRFGFFFLNTTSSMQKWKLERLNCTVPLILTSWFWDNYLMSCPVVVDILCLTELCAWHWQICAYCQLN